jgi:hypothetical protein
MSSDLLGYDTQKSSNKYIIFIGSVIMCIFGFLLAYLNLHHHLNTKYILSHLADLDFYINTPIDAYKYLSQVKFKKDFPFSFVGWWFVYSVALNFVFLFIFILLQDKKSKKWMKRLYIGESLIIALQSAVGFVVIAIIVYFATLIIAGWIFDVDKVVALRYYFMSYPLLLGIVTIATVSNHEDESYTSAIQYKIYPQLKDKMYITNMEQVPDGYRYEYIGLVEATVTNNKDLADAYLLLKAYNMGANGILKYQAGHTAYTHGTVTKYSNNTASGNLQTTHRYQVSGTAVKIIPNE